MKKRIIALVASMLAGLVMFTACDDKTAGGEGNGGTTTDPGTTITVENPANAHEDNTLYIGTAAQGGIYNPLYASSSYDVHTTDLVYERLVEPDDEGHIVMNDRLVKEHSISEDGLVYTITIKDTIKFSNGTPMTANDIVFSYKALMDPSSTAYRLPYATRLKNYEAYTKGELKEFDSVVAVDDHTVEFHFAENYRSNMESLLLYIISEDYYEGWEYGKSEETMNKNISKPIGSGPYVVDEFRAKEFVTLSLNPDYWAKDESDFRIEKIVVSFIESEQEIDKIVTGEIDVLPTTIELDRVNRVRNDEDGRGADKYVNLVQYKRSAYGFFQFNCEHITDPVLRQAVAYLTPRDEFNEVMYGDLAVTIDVPMSQASSIYDAVVGDLVHYDYNPEKALEILLEAGYKQENGKLINPKGEAVVFNFLKTANNPVIDTIYPMIEQSFTDIGIELKEETMEFAAMQEIFTQEDAPYDILFMANTWGSDEPDTWTSNFSSTSIPNPNRSRYNNPEVDKLLIEGRRILDITSDDAIKTYGDIAKILNNDLPQLPIYANILTAMVNNRVHDLRVGTFREWSRGIEGAYIDGNASATTPEASANNTDSSATSEVEEESVEEVSTEESSAE